MDEEKQKNVCAFIAQGMTLKTAANNVGVDDKTVYRHAKRDPQFAEAIEKAKARCESKLVLLIQEAATEDWRAAAWLLKAIFGDKYRRPRNGIPAEQVRMVFQRLTNLLLSQVRSKQDRDRILAKLRNLNGTLSGALRENLRLGFES